LDGWVQRYIKKMCYKGVVVNTAIVMALCWRSGDASW